MGDRSIKKRDDIGSTAKRIQMQEDQNRKVGGVNERQRTLTRKVKSKDQQQRSKGNRIN